MRPWRALLTISLLVPVATAGTYTLAPGDNLSRVARRVGVSVSQLVQANKIDDPDHVLAGRTLTIPTSGSPGAAAPAGVAVGGTGRHTIKAGETLASIARKHGTTSAELQKLNGLANANRIIAGRTLLVPGAGEKWLCPVQGFHSVVNNYGAPRPGYRSHVGNDIFAARGTPVVAPVGGRLRTASGSIAGLALYLEGDDGVTYYFAHLDSLARTGGHVDAGTLIGAVGNTGNASSLPPHLHISISPGGKAPIDPAGILRQGC